VNNPRVFSVFLPVFAGLTVASQLLVCVSVSLLIRFAVFRSVLAGVSRGVGNLLVLCER